MDKASLATERVVSSGRPVIGPATAIVMSSARTGAVRAKKPNPVSDRINGVRMVERSLMQAVPASLRLLKADAHRDSRERQRWQPRGGKRPWAILLPASAT